MVFACCSLLTTFCLLFFACNFLVVIFCMFLITLDITSVCSLLLSLWSFLLEFCYNYALYVLISFKLVLLPYVAASPKKFFPCTELFFLFIIFFIFYFLFFKVAKHYHFLSEVNSLRLQRWIHTCKWISKKYKSRKRCSFK